MNRGEMETTDPLRARLFGYGVPYQVRFGRNNEVQPLATDPAREAGDLARELGALIGQRGGGAGSEKGGWIVSMPLGRCGIEGLPREYLVVYYLEEGYLDVLGAAGYEERRVAEGAILTVLPGTVIRVRARPRPGHRLLVGFQTEDRTPLRGHAAPFTLDNEVPEAYDARLVKAHAAFDTVKETARTDPARYRALLEGFFETMAGKIANDEEIRRIQEEARQQGAYEVADEGELFARQQALLTPEILERIRLQDEELFRFPGMFGGITTLFNLIE